MGAREKLFHVKQFPGSADWPYPNGWLLAEEFKMRERGVFLAVEVEVKLGITV